jgi:hypothetical protein
MEHDHRDAFRDRGVGGPEMSEVEALTVDVGLELGRGGQTVFHVTPVEPVTPPFDDRTEPCQRHAALLCGVADR